MDTPHESRLTSELRRLLRLRRTAALATVDAEGGPFVSLVPFAVELAAPALVLLISGLAAHTRHIGADPRVSLLITEPEPAEGAVHALSRFTVSADAHLVEAGDERLAALRQCYLGRFPDAEPLTRLPDFRYVVVRVRAVRQIAGFGTARDVSVERFERLLSSL